MRSSVIVLIMLALLFGCSKDYSNLPQISVDFRWPKANTYEISPEIILKNVPDSTELFQINMYDLDHRYNHGGGTLANNGSNLIPEGTLKKYEGPYPPGNSRPRYEISVKALEMANLLRLERKLEGFLPNLYNTKFHITAGISLW